MATIQLTKGFVTVVDDEDYEDLARSNWHYNGRGYAARGIWVAGKVQIVLMHRQLLNFPSGQEVDHIDGNPLNNHRDNLRVVTRLQNQWNSRRHTNGSSSYKGVSWNPRYNKWEVQFRVAGARIFVGRFDAELDAARAYDLAIVRYRGEYARLNFPESEEIRGGNI